MALCYAAKKGQNNAGRLLIVHGADLNPMRGEEPITMLPLREAIDDERIETAKLLLDHKDPPRSQRTTVDRAILICVAAASGSKALVERLLKHSCDPEATVRTHGDLDWRFDNNAR